MRDVSRTVAPGELVRVMGPSGSGRTTLLLMLGVLLQRTEGAVRLDRLDIARLGGRKLPAVRLRRVGIVLQDFNLLCALTVSGQNCETTAPCSAICSTSATLSWG